MATRFGRIAVTGAGGFLGNHLVKTAREAGSDALSIVRSASPDAVAIGDLLRDPSRLDGTDVLVHAAAVRHRHGASAESYRASNIDLVEAVLRASAGRVGRFVFVSSVGVFGWPKKERLPVSEASPFNPATLYSWTKVEAEKRVAQLAKELGVAYTIVRPTIIYGPGDTNGMLEKLARMIAAGKYLLVGSGRNTLHHTHVEDVVDGIMTLAGSEAAKNDHFIVAGPETITLARLSELVAKSLGKSVPPIHVPLPFARAAASLIDIAAWNGLGWTEREPPINNEKLDVMTLDIAFDAAKAAKAGFVPRVRYEDGIRRTVQASP